LWCTLTKTEELGIEHVTKWVGGAHAWTMRVKCNRSDSQVTNKRKEKKIEEKRRMKEELLPFPPKGRKQGGLLKIEIW
jgi:hypothetical protein